MIKKIFDNFIFDIFVAIIVAICAFWAIVIMHDVFWSITNSFAAVAWILFISLDFARKRK